MSQYAAALNLPLRHAGKVRELFTVTDGEAERILMVATDAISAHDHVLPTPIPGKGAILTQLSLWWFDQLAGMIGNHVVSTEVPEAVRGRALLVEALDMVPVECVARGYLTGSAWAQYQSLGAVCGIALPKGLRDGDRLPEPLFTPAIKAPLGEHDLNVELDTIARLHGRDLADRLRDLTVVLYTRAADIAAARGLLLADTKFEFGFRSDGTLVLADEALTPDSSRFWDAAAWEPGRPPPGFDKQLVRDWLAHDSGWEPTTATPPPGLPEAVVAATRERYTTVYRRLTGQEFKSIQAPSAQP